jgi:hypothetical protein
VGGVLIAVGIAAAGCGSSTPQVASLGSRAATTTIAINPATAGLLWDRCMRAHRIPEADPGLVNPPIDQNTPQFQAAYTACRAYQVAAQSTQAAQQQTAAFRERLLRWARCIRAHGYPLQDPKFNNQGQVDLMNAYPDDPHFQAAERFCVKYSGAAGLKVGP